jgi:prepilin-type N-terminal cleavage/methylation domain-containing protein
MEDIMIKDQRGYGLIELAIGLLIIVIAIVILLRVI